MTTYIVKYKTKGSFFYKKVKKVQGDHTMESPFRRVLTLEDETRLEIPMEGTEWEFSKDRFIVIKKNMEKESGQDIKTNR